MDNLDDSENHAKISDSAYSNSCSNSQSRRSHSSKSTHSGSHSSGSSGYGGKPSAYSDNSALPNEKRVKDKDGKKKKQIHFEKTVEAPNEAEEVPQEAAPVPEVLVEVLIENATEPTEAPALALADKGSENMDIATPEPSSIKDEVNSCHTPLFSSSNIVPRTASSCCAADGFSCVISMHDGVVMYTNSSLTTTLGFPKDMWIGRSFIDFVHPRDRNTFASHITSGLAVPKNVNGTLEEGPSIPNPVCTMVCRIRKYRNLSTGFGVKERSVSYMPFLLKLTFKNINDDEGKVIYLVIQATPFFSAFTTPNEAVMKPVPFVIRHTASGIVEYIDPESVPYLGYLPQDLADKDALQLYHLEDLPYLRQVYETIVKEGGLARSQAFRLMAQNGDYITVETEWSSFINPWSKKLEFVIGKHHIIEGPSNPDVFQPIEPPEKPQKVNEEERCKAQALRDSIVRIMNEVLTKPAEVAKQQMTKRCQDLATFMESLMEETPKTEDDLQLEIQDADHSYYERDSVMLGGISPHHDHNDSKSSTETPLSYNQLNYNENLQRYFDCHQPYPYEEYSTATGDNDPGMENYKTITRIRHCMSPMGQISGDSGEVSSSESGVMISGRSPSIPAGEHIPRLTQSMLNKHNVEMEKKLHKMHRETRSSCKEERENLSEMRQKKREHLARCNAAFQPTSLANTSPETSQSPQPHGVKRSSKQQESEGMHKHHCTAPRHSRRRHFPSAAPAHNPATSTTTAGDNQRASHWPGNMMNGMNTFIVGVGIPPQMSIMSPMAAMPGHQHIHGLYSSGMIPMYYAPAAAGMPTGSDMNSMPSNSNAQFQPPGMFNNMQCMMYGQAMYGHPFMYSPINHQVAYPVMQQSMMAHNQVHMSSSSSHSLGLTSSNYEEACKPGLPMKTKPAGVPSWRDQKMKNQGTSSKMDLGSDSNSSNALNRMSGGFSSDYQSEDAKFMLLFSSDPSSDDSLSPKSAESVPDTPQSRIGKAKHSGDETVDRTDGESSYSSFYSSFFKTDSGSAEDSGDGKKNNNTFKESNGMNTKTDFYQPPDPKRIARRKMEPPWMEQVCVTSELIYKYQIMTKNVDEVLKEDQIKMKNLEQPALVNEQLGQLYLDLQLEGVAARLTLEEGQTSSGSSGEESSSKDCTTKKLRRKRHYSQLVMIYEEDAPLPPAPDEFSSPDTPAAAEIF